MSTLSTPATHEYYDELAKSLPAPVSDDPELRHRRLSTAIEAFEVLRPGDAYEGRLAVQIVLCGAHAVECMFEASIHREDFAKRSQEDFMRGQVVAAAQIRHDGGVTPRTKAFFHAVALPTDPAVINALVRGRSELLTMLDTFGGEQIGKAA